MTDPSAAASALPLGTVSRDDTHFVLLYGDGNTDPETWQAVAWIAGTDNAPVVELAMNLTPELRGRVEGEVGRRLRVDVKTSTFVGIIDENGLPLSSWRGSLAHRVGTTANWYGDLHWAHRQGR